jgi:hypothetical protein
LIYFDCGAVFSLVYDRLWAMKKKEFVFRRATFPSVKLYRDDVEEILTLITPYAKQISDEKYEYTDLDDLAQGRGNIIHNFSIDGTALGTTFKLTISQTGNYLQVTNKDEIFLQLKEFFKTKRRTGLGLLFLTLSIVTAAIFVLFFNTSWTARIISFSAYLVTLGLLLFWYQGKFSIIHLTQKHQLPSFWKKNRDIWILVLSNILTGIVSAFVAYYLFKHGIKP